MTYLKRSVLNSFPGSACDIETVPNVVNFLSRLQVLIPVFKPVVRDGGALNIVPVSRNLKRTSLIIEKFGIAHGDFCGATNFDNFTSRKIATNECSAKNVTSTKDGNFAIVINTINKTNIFFVNFLINIRVKYFRVDKTNFIFIFYYIFESIHLNNSTSIYLISKYIGDNPSNFILCFWFPLIIQLVEVRIFAIEIEAGEEFIFRCGKKSAIEKCSIILDIEQFVILAPLTCKYIGSLLLESIGASFFVRGRVFDNAEQDSNASPFVVVVIFAQEFSAFYQQTSVSRVIVGVVLALLLSGLLIRHHATPDNSDEGDKGDKARSDPPKYVDLVLGAGWQCAAVENVPRGKEQKDEQKTKQRERQGKPPARLAHRPAVPTIFRVRFRLIIRHAVPLVRIRLKYGTVAPTPSSAMASGRAA